MVRFVMTRERTFGGRGTGTGDMMMGLMNVMDVAVSMRMALALLTTSSGPSRAADDAAAVSAPAPLTFPMIPTVMMPSVVMLVMKPLLVAAAGLRAGERREWRSTPIPPGSGAPTHTAATTDTR
jgi:hypothetical protein